MDYKINVLLNAIENKEVLMDDFQDLLFGMTPEGIIVFDATEYSANAEDNGQFNVRLFMRACKPFIEGFVASQEIDPGKLFYQTPDGHAFIHEQLVFLFLAYTNKVWLTYFNGIVSETINNGVAYSDSYVLKQAVSRIPSEVLEKIIESRKMEDEQPTTN